jgi:hypothetical protein
MDINATQVISSASSSLIGDLVKGIINLPGVTDIILIIKTVGVLIALYIIFLIIRAISQISMASRLKRIANNVEQINSKLDLLVGKKNTKKEKK